MKKLLFTILFSFCLLYTKAQSIDPAYYYLISSQVGSNLNLTVSGDTLITKAKNKVNSWAVVEIDTVQNTCKLKSIEGYYLSQTTAGELRVSTETGTTWTLSLDNNLIGTISGSFGETIYYLEYLENGSVSLNSTSGGTAQKWKFTNTGKKQTN